MGVRLSAERTTAGSRRDLHARRVIVLALELGRRLRVPGEELELLEQALREPAGGQVSAAGGGEPGGVSAAGGRLAAILAVAQGFSERVESLPLQPAGLEQILDEMSWLGQEGRYDPAVVATLGSLVSIRMEDLLDTVHRLPVFPGVALRALQLAGEEDASLRQIESLVGSDQVLAGRLIEAANSSLFSPAQRIGTIRQAVAYIGLETARRVIMTQVLRPLFASARLRQLWKHSLEAAVKAERLAVVCGRVPPEEAFLAGLVHDIGRLALERLAGADWEAYRRWRERGSDAVFAELLLCGFDHGAAGAEILRSWSFPAHLVEGVQYHHRPEVSAALWACLLHLAECWSGAEGDEDLPSAERLERAMKRLGLSAESLTESVETESWLLRCLSEAA